MLRKQDSLIKYLDEINNTVGKRWTFRIILELRRVKTIRYNDLQKLLAGISPSTLSTSLKNLQKLGLIHRESSGSIPPFKVEYSLTDKGFAFLIASYPLLKWAVNNPK
ncbi:MAG: winged helix-turn-helix transcriptional regulator [Nitrosopumilaceae archaeon]